MNKKIAITFILGIIISVATLYLALKNIPFLELIEYLLSINYVWVLPTVVLIVFSFVLRVIRWQFILNSNQRVGFWHAFHPLMISFMINCVLPGRVGEMARPAILKTKEAVPYTTGLATVVAERIFDLGLLIVLFVALFASIKIDTELGIPFGDYTLSGATLGMVFKGLLRLSLLLLAGIVLVSFAKTRTMIKWGIHRIPKLFIFAGTPFKDKIHKKISPPLLTIVDNIAAGFFLLKQPARMSVCLLLTLVIWALHAFSYYLFALGCPGITLTFLELASVMIIICFFISLPSAPGYWGLWEAGGVFGMLLFGVSAREAAGFTLASHAIQLFPVIIAGMVSAFITGVNIWQVSFEKH
jgi:uncharacterized protein (TIRG00374 family)